MSSTNWIFQNKPELALRRAEELKGVGQPQAALTLLHEVLSSRRHKTWSTTYEKIILFYLDLCLELGKSREAKDGLHQYRNLSQAQAPGSLEGVIRHLVEKSEKKCRDAKDAAEKGESSAPPSGEEGEEAKVEDGEDADDDMDLFDGNPQSILLSTMSTDPEKTQRETAVLFPALKFLWEVYRAVLDILKSNSKLERLYHAVGMSAMKFCAEYKRRVEFRRLCDMMRMHLGNLTKYGGVNVARFEDPGRNNKVRGWEGWTPESIELQLQTRFVQLDTSSSLRLYTEGFRTVEDIYNILQISRARRKIPGVQIPPPKAKIMATYYEKLTNLFWVSENYLFHAFAYYKYYSLCKEYNRGMSDEMKKEQASAVLLAALCIPSEEEKGSKSSSSSGRDAIQSTVEDDIAKEKMARMATLLGFHTTEPSREALLSEILARNVMEDVPEYLRELYVTLEDGTDPLEMVDTGKKMLAKLREETGVDTAAADEAKTDDEEKADDDEEEDSHALSKYVSPLTNLLILKLIFSLSTAYHTISLDHVRGLTEGLGVPFEQMEKTIVLSTQSRKVSVRIDHRVGCIRFGSATLESPEMRGQLTALAKRLTTACAIISPPDMSSTVAERSALYSDVRASLEAEHIATLERRVVIEKRKEEAERLVREQKKAEQAAKRAEELARKAEEDRRLAREQKMREREKLQKIQEEMEAMEKKRYLTAMGKNVENITADELKEVDTAKLAKEHAEKANKKKEEEERKIKEASKQLDYLVRAVRIEELPKQKASFEAQIEEDRNRYELEVVEKAKTDRKNWEVDVKDKAALSSSAVFGHTSAFEDLIMNARRIVHDAACKKEDERAETEAEKGKFARARQRKVDEERRIMEERVAAEKAAQEKKAEEERQRKLEEERQRREEMERKERDRMEAQREKERKEASSSGGAASEGKYVPAFRRGDGSGGQSGGSRWGNAGPGYQGASTRERYGGGRYDRDRGSDRGPPPSNSRWS